MHGLASTVLCRILLSVARTCFIAFTMGRCIRITTPMRTLISMEHNTIALSRAFIKTRYWRKKTFTALTEISNAIWECPLIYTNTNSYGSQRQESNLVAEDFALLGADYNAGFGSIFTLKTDW